MFFLIFFWVGGNTRDFNTIVSPAQSYNVYIWWAVFWLNCYYPKHTRYTLRHWWSNKFNNSDDGLTILLIVPIWYYILYNIKVYDFLMQPAIKIISWLKKQQNETVIIFINKLLLIIILLLLLFFQRSAQTRF